MMCLICPSFILLATSNLLHPKPVCSHCSLINKLWEYKENYEGFSGEWELFAMTQHMCLFQSSFLYSGCLDCQDILLTVLKTCFYCSVLLLKADVGMEPRCPTSPHLLLSASIQQKVWFHNTLELDPAGVISSFVIPNPSKDHAYHRPSFTRALYQRKTTGVRREKQPLEYCYEKNKKTHKIQTS